MKQFREALRETRSRQAGVHRQQLRIRGALHVLERQYRAAPAWPLGMAAAGGFLLGYSRRRLPRGVVSTLWSWGMLLVRGLL